MSTPGLKRKNTEDQKPVAKKSCRSTSTSQMASFLEFCLEFLSVKDICTVKMCSKEFQDATAQELKRRANQWKEKVSLGWACGEDDTSRSISADDIPFGQATQYLKTEFVEKYANDKDQLLENIALWCGGWGALLHARENHQSKLTQQPQFNFEQDGQDPKPNFIPGPSSIVLVDVHCEGSWKGTVVIPTCQVRHGTLVSPVCSVQKSCGDEICPATLAMAASQPWHQHLQKFPSYLLSADAREPKEWQVSFSIVSPVSSETFVNGHTVIPNKIWSGERPPQDGINAHLLQKRIPYTKKLIRGYQWVRAEDYRNGRIEVFFCGTYCGDFCQSQPRLHFLLDLVFNGNLLNNMLVRPPPGTLRGLICPCGCRAQAGYCSRTETRDWPEGARIGRFVYRGSDWIRRPALPSNYSP